MMMLLMSILLNVISRSQAGVKGGGERKFYATAVSSGEVILKELIRQIEMISTVSGADVYAVIYSLLKVIIRELSKGKIVRLGDFGSFRISISSEGHDTKEEVSARSVKKARIIFTPGKAFQDMLNNLTFEMA